MIKISMENTKMGMIPSFSLPPVSTCPLSAPCAKNGCYMKKLVAIRPALRKSLTNNLEVVNRDHGNTFKKQLNGWLTMYEPKAFRFHVSGDFFSPWYLDACVSVAKLHPRVKFFAFTKQFDVLSKWMYTANNKLPKNFAIILSAWTREENTWCPPSGLMKRFPVAWVGRSTNPDHYFTAWNNGNIKKCPGKCDECGACFNRKRKDGDLLFEYH